MKVLFFISVFGHGKGGHFHSLNHIAQAMSEHVEIKIFSVGPGRSQVINNHMGFSEHIDTQSSSFFQFRKRIRQIVKKENQDIIHCFDSNVFNLLRLALYPSKSRIVVNLCGGPNPRYFPKVSHLVVFSEENRQWFRSKPKFKDTSIYLIPNRVRKESLPLSTRNALEKDENNFTFLRIARIGKSYKKSIDDSIKLVVKLRDRGIANVFLYIIGTVESQEVFNILREETENLPVRFLTEDAFTKKAANMLYLADAVIATGRGIMEATALGKPILTPSINSDVPILINEHNFDCFSKTNFSQRNVAPQESIDLNFDSVCEIILNADQYKKASTFSTGVFYEKFDVEKGCIEYLRVYNDIMLSEIRYTIFDDIFNQLYYFFKFFKNK